MPDWNNVAVNYYQIKYQLTHTGVRGSHLQPYKDGKWSVGVGHFIHAISHRKHYPSSPPAKNPEIIDEYNNLWQQIGKHGWVRWETAAKALKLMREADAKGAYDYKDGYGKVVSQHRHAFKLVEIKYSLSTTEIDYDDKLIEMLENRT